MNLPPEFPSWEDVWNEHQLRGKMLRSLTRQLDAAVGEIRARREDPETKGYESSGTLKARAAVDAIPELRARLEER